MTMSDNESRFRSRIFNELKLDEKVTMMQVPMEDIPPQANPFRHDSFHMGDSLSRGWMIMHQGGCEGKALGYIILINTNTGQRARIDFRPQEETLKDIISYYPETDRPPAFFQDSKFGIGPFYIPKLGGPLGGSINWDDLIHPEVSVLNFKQLKDPYVFMGDYFVRWKVFQDKEVFFKACKDHFFSDELHTPSESAYEERLEEVKRFIETELSDPQYRSLPFVLEMKSQSQKDI